MAVGKYAHTFVGQELFLAVREFFPQGAVSDSVKEYFFNKLSQYNNNFQNAYIFCLNNFHIEVFFIDSLVFRTPGSQFWI